MVSGILINISYWGVSSFIFSKTGAFSKGTNFPFDHWFIASMLIGMSLFALAERYEWHCSIVNVLAGSAFGVYLIHKYWTVPLIWEKFISVRTAYASAHPVLLGACAIVCIFLVCLLLDLVRQFLFKITVDRHKGRLFDRCWSWAERRLSRLGKHTGMNEGKGMPA